MSEDAGSIFKNSKICIPRYMNQSWQRKSYNDLSLQKVQLHIFQQGADVLGRLASIRFLREGSRRPEPAVERFDRAHVRSGVPTYVRRVNLLFH